MTPKSNCRPRRGLVATIASTTLVAGGLLVPVVAPAVAAADAKMVPGNACQAWGGNTSVSNFGVGSLERSQLGRISNVHTTQPLGVTCPMTREDTSNGDALEAAVVWVFAAPGKSMTCSVRAGFVWGTGSYDFQSSSLTGALPNGTSEHLTFFAVTNGAPLAGSLDSGAMYSAFCLIPDAVDSGSNRISSVGGYYWDE